MTNSLIGNHPSIQKIRELVTMVSGMDLNVLLLGETGTGKDVVARFLHVTSTRRKNRFVKVNCAALPYTLLESELFGYEKGAFTGADKTKPGKFEVAAGGVMFLDEIGDMPLSLQAKLLNVLQSGEYNRLGGTASIKADAWVITATNHDLNKDIAEGLFREDLFYRLNVIKIEIPPLRERKEDIPLLIEYFIKQNQQEYGLDENYKISSDIKKIFLDYEWPGNVRELSSMIRRLMIGESIEEIKSDIRGDTRWVSSINNQHEDKDYSGQADNQQSKIEPLKGIKSEAANFIESQAISHVLNLTRGNKTAAARMLKISYKTLFTKINELGLS